MENALILGDNVQKKNGSFGVVFSDLECSLIGGGSERLATWELYEQECREVSKFIDQILSFNNYFVIVSSAHHDAKERISRKFNYFYNYVSEENRDKLLFFISEVEESKGKGSIFEYENVKVGLIGEKVECVDMVLHELDSKRIKVSNIVGFGDDEKDLDMLFRIQELGGIVGTIAEKDMRIVNEFSYLEIDESNFLEAIKKIVEEEYSIDTMILSHKRLNEHTEGNFFKQLFSSEELEKILEKKNARREELKRAYVAGEIDDQTLQRCFHVARLANRYFNRYHYNDKNNWVGYGEELIGRIYGVSENYSDKALSTSYRLLESSKIKSMLFPSDSQ